MDRKTFIQLAAGALLLPRVLRAESPPASLDDRIRANPLRARSDVQDLANAMLQAVLPHLSAGGALVDLGPTQTSYGQHVTGFEGFARLLWGLGPLAAGGGTFAGGWDRIREGLVHGTSPGHPEYWGMPGDLDQRSVEIPSVALALVLARSELWTPLAREDRRRVAGYLASINRVRVNENNWMFFPVLTNAALAALGEEADAQTLTECLDAIDGMHLGDGWYRDGRPGRGECDYYNPFAFHFYGLIAAEALPAIGSARARRFRERARHFALDYLHWFASDGSALPFGRSLTYRTAQSAFWGALAFASEEALPWGVVKGLYLRNLRWWFQQPIFHAPGLLSIGYAYPNLAMRESYNSPTSPYWACKAFLPLALPEAHPFWTASEIEMPRRGSTVSQPRCGMILSRDETSGHVVALRAGLADERQGKTYADKYLKFTYATAFGFNVRTDPMRLGGMGVDGMLLFSPLDAEHWHGRERNHDVRVEPEFCTARWSSGNGLMVDTWLVPLGAWHVRIHRFTTRDGVMSAEGGFPLDGPNASEPECATGRVKAQGRNGFSGMWDLGGSRPGHLLRDAEGANLLFPHSHTPVLRATHAPGAHLLISAVLGVPASDAAADRLWAAPPHATIESGRVTVSDAAETRVVTITLDAAQPTDAAAGAGL